MSCQKPPIGWICTRSVGHDGPCAAHNLVRKTPVSYLTFELVEREKKEGYNYEYKTKVWDVSATRNGAALGRIGWYGGWRKYVFSPVTHDVLLFDAACLREIADFCEDQTSLHKKAKRKIVDAG